MMSKDLGETPQNHKEIRNPSVGEPDPPLEADKKAKMGLVIICILCCTALVPAAFWLMPR